MHKDGNERLHMEGTTLELGGLKTRKIDRQFETLGVIATRETVVSSLALSVFLRITLESPYCFSLSVCKLL